MDRNSPPYTVTMAKVYAGQGYLHKAAQILRHLLEKDPNRTDCRAALAELEQQIVRQGAPSRKEISLLMREWVDLLETRSDRRLSK